jgi:phage tail sheath protein FI
MAFLHGVETITIIDGKRTIAAVPSSIIILVGIAPEGPVNIPTLVANSTDAAQFGKRLAGFNIPEALDSILAHGSGIVIVINTYTEAANAATVTAETVTITDSKFKLAFNPVNTPVVKDAATSLITYEADADYSIDEFGNGLILDPATITAGTIKVTYKKLDASTVNAAQINGTLDAETGDRTGFYCVDLIPTTFGFKPKVFIAPGYSAVPAISANMLTYCIKYRGVRIMDAPEGTQVGAIITHRGPAGTIGWNVSDSRTLLVYPKWEKSDPDPRAASDDIILEWYSAIFAGVIAATDKEFGYWFSPSNKNIMGVVGPEIVITCSMTDSTAQNQLLNAAGIIAYFNAFGTGLRTWGNRSAMYPSDTQAVNFINIQRIKDILEDSVEAAQLPYVDQPINSGTIDAVRETVNGFMRTMIQKGALIDGKCYFDTNLNPVEELAAGHVVYSFSFMGPTPMERMTFNSHVDVSMLSKLLVK